MFQFKFLNELNECLKTINDGGIILHPTDTVYGIGGNANDNNATGANKHIIFYYYW